MAEFIDLEIETDAEVLSEEALSYLATVVPGFDASEGNLETWMVKACARIAAEIRDLAADVPAAIFRKFGSDLIGLEPVDDAPATVTSTWTFGDTLGHTIDDGTLVAISSGDQSYPFQVVGTYTVASGDSATADGEVLLEQVLQDGQGGEDANGLTGDPLLIDSLDAVPTITLEDETGSATETANGLDAEEDEEYLNRLRTRLQLLSPRPILSEDFAVLLRSDVTGVARAVAVDNYDPEHNMLTAQQASLEENNTTGFAVGTNCTIASSTAHAADGLRSLELSSAAGGAMDATTLTGTNGEVVTPGETYTFRFDAKAGSDARTVTPSIIWYTAAGAVISTSDGVAAADNTTSFTSLYVTAVAPATAAFAAGKMGVAATGGASEEHYFDKLAFRRGTSTVWKAGDSPETDVERMVTVAAIDEDGEPVSSGIKATGDAYLEDMREANFVVHIVDPTYTAVDVAFTATALPEYDTASVEADAEAAVADYLDPATWGTPREGDQAEWRNATVVRLLEVAEVINAVDGIDYIDTLTIEGAAANYTLPGAIPLPTAGTIAGTVSEP